MTVQNKYINNTACCLKQLQETVRLSYLRLTAFPALRRASAGDLLPTLCLGLLALMLLSHRILPSSKIAQQPPQCGHVPRRSGSATAMATVLERADKKAYMDDSVPLKAAILTHRALPDHVVRFQHTHLYENVEKARYLMFA